MILEEGDEFAVRRDRILTHWTILEVREDEILAESGDQEDVWDKDWLYENLEFEAEIVKEEMQ